MLTGKHPFFKKGDNEKSYIKRISQGDLEVEIPFSDLAASLFWKLCSRSLADRYSANQAIKHPWITRDLTEGVIPLTQSEEVKLIEADALLRRVQSAVLFIAIQKMNDRVTTSSSDEVTKSSTPLSPGYLKRIDLCNNGQFSEIAELTPQNSNSVCKESLENDIFQDKSQ